MKIKPSEKMQELGRLLATNGHVQGVHPNLEDKAWYAKINDREVCHVKLDATDEGNDVCTCQDWVRFGICRHICAAEYYLQLKGKSRYQLKAPRVAQRIQVRERIDEVGRLLSDYLVRNFEALEKKNNFHVIEAQDDKLRFEVQLEEVEMSKFLPEKNLLGLTLRVGLKDAKTLLVKNVQEFFEACDFDQEYRLSKGHTTVLAWEKFDASQRELLFYLQNIFRSGKIWLASEKKSTDKNLEKYILLPVFHIEEILEKLNAFPAFSYKIGNLAGTTLHLSNNVKILDYEVTVYEKTAVLKNFTHTHRYFSKYQWIFLKNQLVPLSDYQDAIYRVMLELERRSEGEESITFRGENYRELFLKVIPGISEIGHVSFKGEHEQECIVENLKVSITFALDGDYLHAQYQYQYGDAVFSNNPALEQIPEGAIVVRDLHKERMIEQLFEQFHYDQGAVAYVKRFPVGEERYSFFTKELAAYRKYADVTLSPELESFFINDLEDEPKLTIRENNSWLDIDFDISSIREEEVQKVLEAIVEDKPFIELVNGQLLNLEDESFSKTAEALKSLRERIVLNKKGFRIKNYHGVEIKDRFSYIEDTDFQKEFSEMVHHLKNPEDYPAPVPKNLQAEMREYQKVGFRWMKMLSEYHFGGILADDMGLGKTLQTISFLLSEKEEGKLQAPALIVMPTSLIYNWEIECQKFAPDLHVLVMSGTKQARTKLLEQSQDFDAVITSYGSFRSDAELYAAQDFQFLIMDEAQAVKNSTTKTYHSLKKLEVAQRFALTGTPMENNLEELWAIFELLMPGFFPNKTKFKKITPKEVGQMIRPFVLRREKKTVLDDLPDKIEMNLYSELTEPQKVVYVANLEKMQRQVLSMDSATLSKNKISILSGLTRLRQVCCDPSLFLKHYKGSSGKLDQLKELMVTAQESGRRVLIFSQFTTMLTKIKRELEKMGLSTFYLHGQTPAKERIKMVESFNAGEGEAFLVSLKAGGTGLNLTGADTVILYDLWWNPAVEEQAASRAHRIGQKKVVEVWRLITKGTIEEKIYQLQQDKKELFQKVIADGQEVALKRLTEEDIRQILSIGAEDEM